MSAFFDEILAAETAVWQALARGDTEADERALAEDFLGVYPDGFAGRAAHVGQLAHGPTVADFTLSDVRVRALGPDHAMIAYRAAYRRTRGAERDHAPETLPETMYVSSIWRRAGGGWVNLFSQDTPATGISVP